MCQMRERTRSMEHFFGFGKALRSFVQVNELFTMRGHIHMFACCFHPSARFFFSNSSATLYRAENAPNVYINCWFLCLFLRCCECDCMRRSESLANVRTKNGVREKSKCLNSFVQLDGIGQCDKWQLHSIWVD